MSASSLFPELPASQPGGNATTSSFGATQSLYRKYRPQTFAAVDLVGQDAIVRTLKNAIRLDRVAHAYLFTGPRGTGKTTTARLLAKAVNCLDPDPDARPCNHCAACIAINNGSTTDVIEIDAASNRGIDDIRELRERVRFAPTFLKTKFYIVDEAHQITGAAANAFLKTLEEPPPHTKFILATTDPEQLLPTIVSRCQRFDFKRFPRETIMDHLGRVADVEGVAVSREALAVIGEHAGGSMRDALGLLDQLASYRNQEGDENRTIEPDDVRNLLGIARSERVIQMARALADGDAGARVCSSSTMPSRQVRILASSIASWLRFCAPSCSRWRRAFPESTPMSTNSLSSSRSPKSPGIRPDSAKSTIAFATHHCHNYRSRSRSCKQPWTAGSSKRRVCAAHFKSRVSTRT